MKRIVRIAVATICLGTLFLLPMAAGAGEELVVVKGKKVYLVKPGDTLAGIAQKVFGDANRWREIWKANPQISKPGLIFPGDTLVVGEAPPEVALGVRDKQEAPSPAGPAAPAPVVAPQEFMTGRWEQPEVKPIVLSPATTSPAPSLPPALFETCGYITADLPEAAILGSPDGRETMSRFDIVFINQGDRHGLTVGQEFRILHPVRQIRDPRTGRSLGWLVQVVGRLRADCLQKVTATGQITQSYGFASVGDRLEPYVPVNIPAQHFVPSKLTGPCVPSPRVDTARMLASRGDHEQISEGDVVYLDRGLDGGISPGTRMAVYRQGLPGDDRGTYLVGELQVLLSQNATATALVTNSVHQLSLSDRVAVW